ncbi:MAG TPA: TolC family outer membrane protein [Gammaproteobacteria bacterium]|nr:TolC family outer membrane protein [Gammaproteobacteria bacterium]
MDCRKRLQWLLFVFCLAGSPALIAEDLRQVYQRAEGQDPQFQGVQATYEAVLESRPQARAQFLLPNLSINSNFSQHDQGISLGNQSICGNGPTDANCSFVTRGYSINLTQPVYHYDKYLQFRQTDDRIRQAQLDVDAARQDLIVRISGRYFDVLAALDNLEFAGAEKNALARQLEQAQQRFNVGLIAITDVQEAKAGYDQSVADEIAAQKQLDDARQALREFAGEIEDHLASLSDKMPLITPEPADIEQWTNTALKQNFSLASAQAATRIAEQEIEVQRAGHYPTLDVVGSHGNTISGGGRFGDTDTVDSAIGMEMNLPIYEGGFVQSRTREAEHRHEAAVDQEEQQRRSVIRTCRDAYRGVISGISRIQALQQAVVSQQTALEATEAGFEVGTRTTVDVVTQERQLFAAKRDYARARYDYIVSTLQLKQAAGTLTPADLDTINQWLAH